MKLNFVLVDYENVQPRNIELLQGGSYKIKVFLGAHQGKIPLETARTLTISFGQQLVPEVIDRAMRVSARCDLFVAVGTSLQVFPAANTLPAAHAAGARIVIVNGEPTPFDPVTAAVLRRSISEVLPAICLAR